MAAKKVCGAYHRLEKLQGQSPDAIVKVLYLEGERCSTPKCAIERRAFAAGMHGQARKRKTPDYGLQLRAKQQAGRVYGPLENLPVPPPQMEAFPRPH